MNSSEFTAEANATLRPGEQSFDKLAPQRCQLVVIDMQNDFVSPGGATEQAGFDVGQSQAILPALQKLVKTARLVGIPVVMVRSLYNTSDGRYLSDAWLRHWNRQGTGYFTTIPVCEPGTWGVEFATGLEPQAGEAVVTKHRNSAFHATDLNLILSSVGSGTVVVGGVGTPGCVESTVRDAFFHDYDVVVASDCCASFTPDLHQFALERMDLLFAEVQTSSSIIDAWDVEPTSPSLE